MVSDRKGSLQHSATNQNIEDTPISLETPQALSLHDSGENTCAVR